MFHVRRAGAKGLGVFASRHIPRGTRLLAEPPLLSITRGQPDVLRAASLLSNDNVARLLQLSTNDSRRARQASLALSLLPTLSNILTRKKASLASNRRVLNVFYNNNFAIGDEAGTRALFPTVARLNHSCIPSAQGNFNATWGHFTIHSLRDIPADEEITISYLHDEMAPRAARQASLKAGYGFECGCPICAASDARTASDARRAQHHKLLREYHSHAARSSQQQPGSTELASAPSTLLAMVRRLTEAYEAEGLAGRETASLYSLAARHAMAMGDKELAQRMGKKALDLERDAVGEDSPFFHTAREALERLDFAPPAVVPAKARGEGEEDEALSYAPWT
ncbi:uncharacterized protein B0I36DRAFT_360066 [Microdochium trichocladiopsis]|uniref:SET domain-containing protein n=1 Tax=Microdochium trichocladiopsis TaxID=1682393 RepID=A0A9P8YA91_9PEZI|nr:uncharacterized protein B0I36DRAFT_360066 [Microdochium trichocladiopsis]KAH7034552.1 hypothetical protein B0I36DRAFT_360066 [Microdochium trichocladiopsis]